MKFSQFEYRRPSVSAYQEKTQALSERLVKTDSIDEAEKIIREWDNLNKEIESDITIAMVRASIDTSDQFYSDERTFIDENSPQFAQISNSFIEKMLALPYLDQLKPRFSPQFFTVAEFSQKLFNDQIIDDLVKENTLCSEYSKLLASAEIEFDGKTYNLSGIGKLILNDDRQYRQRVVEARDKYVASVADQLDRIYDELVKCRNQIAKKLGYESFTQVGYLRQLRVGYGKEEVAVFRQQIKDVVVPLSNQVYQRQAKRLNLDKLTTADYAYQFATGAPTPILSAEEIIEQGRKMYHELSAETGEFFDYMVENELLDLVTKPKKEGGGYCTFITRYKAPFIFSNFNGTAYDITVLTHEAGHAFQAYQSRFIEENSCLAPSLEACEIHSMSMEYFTYPWLERFFGKDAPKYIYKHLSDTITFLPYGTLVDEFQHVIYDNPDLTPQQRKQVWKDLNQQYLPLLDYSDSYFGNGSRWQLQSHIYLSPFYYIDYCLASTAAMQFYIKGLKDFQSTWQDYLKLCQVGGRFPYIDMLKLAKLVSPFEQSSLKTTIDEIALILSKIDDSKL